MSSKAPYTEKYLYAFDHWKKRAEAMDGVTVFPVEAIYLALYLQHLGNSTVLTVGLPYDSLAVDLAGHLAWISLVRKWDTIYASALILHVLILDD